MCLLRVAVGFMLWYLKCQRALHATLQMCYVGGCVFCVYYSRPACLLRLFAMLSHSLSVMFSGILEILQVVVQFKHWWYGSHVDLLVRWYLIGGLDPLEMCSVVRANNLKGNNTFAVNELQAKITVRGNRSWTIMQ